MTYTQTIKLLRGRWFPSDRLEKIHLPEVGNKSKWFVLVTFKKSISQIWEKYFRNHRLHNSAVRAETHWWAASALSTMQEVGEVFGDHRTPKLKGSVSFFNDCVNIKYSAAADTLRVNKG